MKPTLGFQSKLAGGFSSNSPVASDAGTALEKSVSGGDVEGQACKESLRASAIVSLSLVTSSQSAIGLERRAVP